MSGQLIEFKLNEGAEEGNALELAKQFSAPGGEKENSIPLGAVVINPSDFAAKHDEAGIRALIEERAGVTFAGLKSVVRRLTMVDKCLTDPGNHTFVKLCAKDFGYPDFEAVVNGKTVMVSGSYTMFKHLANISQHEVLHRNDKEKQFYTVRETLFKQKKKLEALESLVAEYLVRVGHVVVTEPTGGVAPQPVTSIAGLDRPVVDLSGGPLGPQAAAESIIGNAPFDPETMVFTPGSASGKREKKKKKTTTTKASNAAAAAAAVMSSKGVTVEDGSDSDE